MKTRPLLWAAILMLLGGSMAVGADTFLEAPLVPGGKIVLQSEKALEWEVGLSHDQAVAFYRNALKDLKDIKFREWKESTYIEDDGNRPWHSITIPRKQGEKITIRIKKDSWTWIFSTLILRYIGVFVVLMVIYAAISASGRIISRVLEKMDAAKKAA